MANLLTEHLDVNNNTISQVEPLLNVMKSVVLNSKTILPQKYMVFLYDGLLSELLNLMIGRFICHSIIIYELDGMADNPFEIRSVSSVRKLHFRDSTSVYMPPMDGRFICLSYDAKIVIFSDFDDFQIILIDYGLYKISDDIRKFTNNIVIDFLDMEIINQKMASSLKHISRRAREWNSELQGGVNLKRNTADQ